MLTFDNILNALLLIGGAVLAGFSPEQPVRWFGIISMLLAVASFVSTRTR